MNPRTFLAGVAWLAVLAGGVAVLQQRGQLANLETRAAQAQAAQAAVRAKPLRLTAVSVPGAGLSEAERLELFRLRAEVTRLRARQAELAPVRAENQALRDRIRQQSPPPGYVRMREAQFAGQASPEAAFQSFIWAIASGDTNALCQILVPNRALEMLSNLQEEGQDELLAAARIIPGYRIVATHHDSDAEVRLKVEFLPGRGAEQVGLVLEEGRWRVNP